MIDVPNDPSYSTQITIEPKTYIEFAEVSTSPAFLDSVGLTNWGRVTFISVSKITTIGSDHGLLPGRRQTIIWTNAILSIGPTGTNFSEILIKVQTFSFKEMRLKVSPVK